MVLLCATVHRFWSLCVCVCPCMEMMLEGFGVKLHPAVCKIINSFLALHESRQAEHGFSTERTLQPHSATA